MASEKVKTDGKVQTGVSFELANLHRAMVMVIEKTHQGGRWDRSALLNWLIEQEWARVHPGEKVQDVIERLGLD